MRVVFAGTPAFPVPSLKGLLAADAVEPAVVYTQPDRPAGRGRRQRQSAIKEFALAHRLPLCQPANFNDGAAIDRLREWRPDLMVVVAYGLILPAKVLSIPPLGCINVHASLLPRWRGAAPIQRAIEAGDTSTGISLMQMDEGLDTGPVLARSEIAIEPDDTGGSLHDKLAELGGALLADNLPAIAARSLDARPQDETLACYASKLDKGEAVLDWRLDALDLERKVRAFNPWPVAVSELGDVVLRILGAWSDRTAACSPVGKIVAVDKTGITVATGTGRLTLTRVQKPGGKPMPVAALLQGMKVEVGMGFTVPS